ncbi:MAG TPA: hypothetical protein VFO19_16890 [Vicinamibacterales bacterium]|nr:hypothetical protein [Vicinamibacterales bacterium]
MTKTLLRAVACLPAILLAAGAAGACVDRLPDEDLRITTAVPAEKLPAELLWKDFQTDAAAATSRYFGKAVEITGVVTQATTDGANEAYVLFVPAGSQFGVRANLLRDRAQDVLDAGRAGEKITLRCFCQGLDGHVVLKSCIKP